MKPSLFDLLAFTEARQFVQFGVALGVPVEHSVEPRKGAAPPRKRPRRVLKKLAARGFRAHFEGSVMFSTEQVKTTRLCWHSLPRESVRATRSLRVQLAPLLLRDGRLQRAPVAEGYHTQIVVSPPRPVVKDWAHEPPWDPEREVYHAAQYLFEADVLFPVPVTLSLCVLVFAMDGADVEIALEQPAERVLHGFALAVRYPTTSTVVSRQTSYRPRGE